MTHLDIINRALVAAGSNPKADMEDTKSNEVSSIRAYYETCWREVLSAHSWSELQQEELLQGFLEDTGNYRFDIPDTCIKISTITDVAGNRLHDVKIRGKYLYSSYDALFLTFVSTQNILPVDWLFVNNELDISLPPAIDDVVSLRLASQIVFRISQNQNLQTHLHNRYMVSLQNARMNDMQGTGGQSFWGESTEYRGSL